MSEEQLIKEIKAHKESFGKIYDLHYQAIFNYCYRRTSSFDNAKDITSETFLKAYLNIDTFKWKGIPIINWLYRIATNEINLYFRSASYRPKLLNEVYKEILHYKNPTSLDEEREKAELELKRHNQFLAVQKALKELPVKYQDVISLKYFEKLKIKEISIVLNKKEGTIKSLLSRGISKLKDKL